MTVTTLKTKTRNSKLFDKTEVEDIGREETLETRGGYQKVIH